MKNYTLRKEKTKPNRNEFEKNNQIPVLQRHSTFDKDFSTVVQNVSEVKLNTKKNYENKFPKERIDSETNYAKEIMHAALMSKNQDLYAGIGDPSSINHVLKFDEDIKDIRKESVSVFPVGEENIFPPRRPQTGWEVGLRKYDDKIIDAMLEKKKRQKELQRQQQEQDNLEGTDQIDEESTQDIHMRQPFIKPKLTQQLTIAEMKRIQYSKHELEPLTAQLTSRYFGTTSVQNYHKTYQQLQIQGQILNGGYKELHEIVSEPFEENKLNQGYNQLASMGILSPRQEGQLSIDPIETETPIHTPKSSIQKKAKSPHNRRRANDPDPSSPTYHPGSPRAIFLSGCLEKGLPPRAVVMLRKRISSTINLAHMGIGNEMAKLLAEAIPTLPYLQVLNLCDNNLEDDGLSAIIHSIAKHPTVDILDISQNIIDTEAANALADFIGNEQCLLKCLRMSDANIDDGECSRFVDVLMHNRHLQELDMSKNLLGKDENLNSVQPDFVTGGESLAELIRIGSCPITTLNLHWNMIRLEGAEVLCDSIRNNPYLTNLDLSYNALGRSAACVLGNALMENKVLKTLNIANNGIDAIGCFTLFVGLRENDGLSELILDGNPIGEQGARVMMKVATEQGDRLQISAKNCDFNILSSDVKFRLNEPYGDHLLNLSDPYDRAILIELLEIVANDTNLDIPYFELYDVNAYNTAITNAGGMKQENSNTPPPNLKGTRYKVVKFEEAEHILSQVEEQEKQDLYTFIKAINKYSIYEMKGLIRKYNKSSMSRSSNSRREKDTISKETFRIILRDIKIDHLTQIANEMIFTLDPFECGQIDIDELVECLYLKIKSSEERVKHINSRTRCAVIQMQPHEYGRASMASASKKRSSETMSSKDLTSMVGLKRYIPPNEGFVYLRVIEAYNVSDDKQVQGHPLSHSRCVQLMKAAELSSSPLQLLLFAVDSFVLYLEEAQMLYNYIAHKSDDPTPALAKILLRMHNTNDSMRMMHCYASNDVLKQRRIKQRLGNAYYPLIGIYSGFYMLDLNNEFDRICLRKLVEKSARNIEARRERGLWDTSQYGHWSCFRNELHQNIVSASTNAISTTNTGNEKEVANSRASTANAAAAAAAAMAANAFNVGVLPDKHISPKNFYPIPSKGKLEFDFVNIERPNLLINQAVSDDYIIDVMILCRLIDESHCDDAYYRLAEYSRAQRRTSLPDGSVHWIPEMARAVNVGEQLYTCYSTLNHRRAAHMKAVKREAIKSAPVEKSGKKGIKSENKTGGRSSYYSSAQSAKKVKAVANILVQQAHTQQIQQQQNHNGPTQTSFNSAVSGVPPTMSSASADVLGPDAVGIADPTPKIHLQNVGTDYMLLNYEFRSLQFRSRASQIRRLWSSRLYETVVESTGSDEYKCIGLLEFFECELATQWLYCKHIAVLLEAWSPLGLALRSNVGTYRVELIVILFDRILDLHNFEVILMVLTAEEHAALFARIGILNVFNPAKPEGSWALDLSRWEERQITKMMIHLSVVEPGENWLNKQFIFDRGFSPIQGWDLNVTWLNEEGLPKKGLLTFEMFAGDGARRLECCVDIKLRRYLSALVLIEARNYPSEIERRDMLIEEKEPFPGAVLPAFDNFSSIDSDNSMSSLSTTAILSASTPTYAMYKLRKQCEILKLLQPIIPNLDQLESKERKQRELQWTYYTLEDVEKHLSQDTDITWTYSSGNMKYESWLSPL